MPLLLHSFSVQAMCKGVTQQQRHGMPDADLTPSDKFDKNSSRRNTTNATHISPPIYPRPRQPNCIAKPQNNPQNPPEIRVFCPKNSH